MSAERAEQVPRRCERKIASGRWKGGPGRRRRLSSAAPGWGGVAVSGLGRTSANPNPLLAGPGGPHLRPRTPCTANVLTRSPSIPEPSKQPRPRDNERNQLPLTGGRSAQVCHLFCRALGSPPEAEAPTQGRFGPRLFSGSCRVRRRFLRKPLIASLSSSPPRPNPNSTTMKASLLSPCPESQVVPLTEEHSIDPDKPLGSRAATLLTACSLPAGSLGTVLTAWTHQRPLGRGRESLWSTSERAAEDKTPTSTLGKGPGPWGQAGTNLSETNTDKHFPLLGRAASRKSFSWGGEHSGAVKLGDQIAILT